MQGSHVICLSSLKNSLQCHRVMMSVFLHDHLHLAGDTNCGSSSWGFFSFSWSWILVKNLKRKTKLFFHHFMYLSVASSRTRSAMIYNESILLCCSLPCMWVSMQISLLCTGRNFPPWISSNRHMWGGWGGGITGGVDDAEMGCTSSWFLSANLTSKGANLSVYSNFLSVFREKELMSVFCCWGRSTLSGNSS